MKSRTRRAVERRLGELDNESFGWAVTAILHVFPEELSGFREIPRVEALQRAAQDYLAAYQPSTPRRRVRQAVVTRSVRR